MKLGEIVLMAVALLMLPKHMIKAKLYRGVMVKLVKHI
jgi:hypothetical protein